MVSIFSYGFKVATESFSKASLTWYSLTDYTTLIGLAIEKGIVSADQEDILLKWQEDPANWKGVS
jgi:orotate phosphoribosyltransferase